ncbi:acyltransferase [Cohnella suwonensis]|uniref:Acyltransferase n=1 Tax=Cohnella suwonensis TaxID=696072 RepID=A0ABW0LUY5_9BACL
MERRAKLTEIDIVRGIAILGVLMVHSTSEATLNMKSSGFYGIYNFLNIFSKIGTTSFILLSSFVLFYNYFPQPFAFAQLKKFYRNRLLYIIVPYLAFSAFFFLLRWEVNHHPWSLTEMWPDFLHRIMTGQAYTHLYFVFISIQLYLLFPVLLYLFKRFKWLAASAIFVGVAIQWAFFLYNREYWQVANRGSWSLSYFGHYFLGAWLGIYFDRIRSWLIIAKESATGGKIVSWCALWAVWLGAGLGYVWLFYQNRVHGTMFKNALYDGLWDAYTMLTPIVLIQIAFLLRGKMKSPWVAALRQLGIASFGVYLFHPVVLLVYRQYPLHGGPGYMQHLWYAGGFACALLLSWLVVYALSRLTRVSWVLFGSVPAQLGASASESKRSAGRTVVSETASG